MFVKTANYLLFLRAVNTSKVIVISPRFPAHPAQNSESTSNNSLFWKVTIQYQVHRISWSAILYRWAQVKIWAVDNCNSKDIVTGTALKLFLLYAFSTNSASTDRYYLLLGSSSTTSNPHYLVLIPTTSSQYYYYYSNHY